jgi:hypothetical protein
MTVHDIKGVIAFSCDSCPDTITPNDQSDFSRAWGEARHLGWHAFKLGWGAYEHECPDCARRYSTKKK